MNIENMRRVRKAVADADAATGTGFGMAYFFHTAEGKDWGVEECDAVQAKYGECGTLACVGGHAFALALQNGLQIDESCDIETEACKFLGVEWDDGDYLFYGHPWRDNLHAVFRTMSSITREEVLQYLDLCIEAEEMVRVDY